ncbi:MAG: hypothetical protein BWY09_03223 [Candidatus Hydrogenedentes bacterium ADurb.Bin179]|nr:MAG: hypothetical protein BWY09_03223 [Candidatus Hydrogenedentes bacterium ADurb.Bin179]
MAFRDAALLVPVVSAETIDHIQSVLRDKGAVTYGNRIGRKTDWLARLYALVQAGLLVKSRKGHETVFMLPAEASVKPVPESMVNSNV